VQNVFFLIGSLADVGNDADSGRQDDHDCHNYYCDGFHKSSFLVPLLRAPRKQKLRRITPPPASRAA